jgi:phosphoglycolate phosphatase-like HAD superfamily hydrolase
MIMEYQSTLKDLERSMDFFIGIDSDGCVFDTMEIKHKEFFIPNVIKYFDLFAISGPVRETWEFVNLYSLTRGVNRFPALVKVFELLGKRKEILEKGFPVPDLSSLKKWISAESQLSNSSLRSYCINHKEEGLEKVLRWSEAVNEDINRWLRNMPPFPHAKAAIEKTGSFADTIVVSQTPQEALEREWKEHDLRKYVRAIAGQEYGTKSQHISFAAIGKYDPKHILMIGDAPGDLKAARDNGVLFFPIIPGLEDHSWKRLLDEGLGRFFNGSFSNGYQDDLIEDFMKHLPATPPWEE